MKRLLNQETFCCLPVFAPKKRLANWVFFFLFLGFSSFSFASPAAFSRSLTGKVTNADGSPLSGVTVTLKGTAVAVSTDNAGEFTIEVPDDQVHAVLVFSSVGYVSQEISADGKSVIPVKMETDIRNLNDALCPTLNYAGIGMLDSADRAETAGEHGRGRGVG